MVTGTPWALWYISHVSGGERPPDFTVLGTTLCQALPALAWGDIHFPSTVGSEGWCSLSSQN